MENERAVNKILGRLGNSAGKATKQNGKIASSFLQSLQNLIYNETGILKDATFMHAGSAYEGLSVNAEADFDIPLILSGPGKVFSGQNFEIYREQHTRCFLLKWKNNCHSDYRYQYNSNGYVCCKSLLDDSFERLKILISSLSGWEVKITRGLVSLVLEIDSGGSTKISMDLSPQIAFRSWNCPDLIPLHKLPEALKTYVEQLQNNASPIFLISLTVQNADRMDHYSTELCNISFAMLEKKFLVEEEKVRDIVRLVKLISECKDWKKKYYIKSFQLKRLAIRHVNELKHSEKWNGVKLLLNYIYNDLQDNTIKGFFIKDQVIFTSKTTNVNDIRREISEVRNWTPSNLLLQAFGVSEIDADRGVVNQILGHVDSTATVTAKLRKKHVDTYLDDLKQFLGRETGILRGATVMHAGSSYEGLVVSHDTDFDVCIVLASPFSGDNFQVVRDPQSKLFRLRWLRMPNEPYKKYVSGERYLNAKLLQNELLDRLKHLTNDVSQKMGWHIHVKKQVVANMIEIKCTCGTVAISMDLAPQIAVRKWHCPDIVALSRLPATLQSHIERLEANSSPIFFYSLDAPNTENFQNTGELCQVSFSMLEKKFLQENCDIRDMLRLVKVVAFLQDWKKKYGLTSFQLKRLTIKHMDELSSLGTWQGYQRLLTFLFNDLQDMSIKGFFIKDQEINIYKPQSVDRFKDEIHKFRQWSPSQLLKLVYDRYAKSIYGHSLIGSCS